MSTEHARTPAEPGGRFFFLLMSLQFIQPIILYRRIEPSPRRSAFAP